MQLQNQSNESRDNIRSHSYNDFCTVATLVAMAHTNATWRMQHRLWVVNLDGLAAQLMIAVACGSFVTTSRCPVVVEDVTDIDEAASRCSSAVTVAEASTIGPVTDDGAPGVAVTSE